MTLQDNANAIRDEWKRSMIGRRVRAISKCWSYRTHLFNFVGQYGTIVGWKEDHFNYSIAAVIFDSHSEQVGYIAHYLELVELTDKPLPLPG